MDISIQGSGYKGGGGVKNLEKLRYVLCERSLVFSKGGLTGGHSRGSPSVSCIERKYNRMDIEINISGRDIENKTFGQIFLKSKKF